MQWFLRGVQSAVFHYASCAPCLGLNHRNKRRKQAKRDEKARSKLEREQPDVYHHPLPTETNAFWREEMELGPGPPLRKAKRTNTGSQQGGSITKIHSAVASQASSTVDVDRSTQPLRLSGDTIDDDKWNCKRYQREDESLWGIDEPISPTRAVIARGSSVGLAGATRPSTSKSSAETYYTVRVPPVNDLHPPIVSLPSSKPSDNQWMLQPPPRASVMSGKERATTRSRSGSGASSRVELSLQRQVSARQLQHKFERGETPELLSMSGGNCYSNSIAGPRPERSRTPQPRPLSAASSKKKKRGEGAPPARNEAEGSSGDSSDTIVRTRSHPRTVDTPEVSSTSLSKSVHEAIPAKASPVPTLKVVRIRSNRPRLSTLLSSGSEGPPASQIRGLSSENQPVRRHSTFSSTESSDSVPYLMKHRKPLSSSDISSLNALQDLVSPPALLKSRFVSAPLMEARIKLPPSDAEEETTLSGREWLGSGFAISRDWIHSDSSYTQDRVPFDSLGAPERDPTLRWSVDF